MASISLYVVFSFIVIIGSVPCESHVCTRQTVNKCIYDNIDRAQECQAYNKTIVCLRDELENCTDDDVIESIEGEIKLNEREMAQCPGLPDGVCYFSELLFNCGTPSIFIQHPSSQHKERTEKACNDFNGKSSHMRTCTENIKLKCVDVSVLNFLDAMLGNVDKAEKLCAEYQKT